MELKSINWKSMQVNEKKVNSRLFKKVVAELRVDDSVVTKIDGDECIIKLSSNNNLPDDLSASVAKSSVYDINLTIKDEILYIRYIKEDLILINNPDFYETVGIIILLPKDVEYEQFNC